MAENTQFLDHYIMRILLEGITPFLQNNPKGMTVKGPEIDPSSKNYDPAVCAEAATYRRDDGGLGFPACALRACLITAGVGIKVGQNSLATLFPKWLGHFPPLEGDELFPFEDEDGRVINTYTIDIRRGIRRGGVPIARPKIWPWRMRARLKLTLPAKTNVEGLMNGLLQVANKAGQYPGLGDGRPERIKGKGLWFGKFKVIDFTVEPLSE